MYIDQLDAYLPQEIYLDGIDDPVMIGNMKLIYHVMNLVNPEMSEKSRDLAKEIVEFEIKLAEIADRREERRDLESLNHHMTLDEIQGNFSYINWTEYINALLPQNRSIKGNETILVSDINYLTKLGSLLENTHDRILYNYITWTIISDRLSILSTEFRRALAQLDKVIYGTEEESLRWDECSELAVHLMPQIVGAMYVREFLSNESRIAVIEIVQNIVSEFKNVLNEITWMDLTTKNIALEKIYNLAYFVGHADELTNDTLLEKYFGSMDITDENITFFDLVLKISKFSTEETMGLLSERNVVRNDWRFLQTPATVNAFYLASHNHIGKEYFC